VEQPLCVFFQSIKATVASQTARHFLPVETLKRQIDAMSFNKMNTMHWHVTDAESMPIQSQRFPMLHEKGAFGPKAFYSTAQIEELVTYAAQRGVRVLPEFDMPGHNYAYFLGKPELMCECPNTLAPISTEFWKASFDPTNPELYDFLDAFLGEMTSRFPEQILHLGGDE
jgi:hexosaminidase